MLERLNLLRKRSKLKTRRVSFSTRYELSSSTFVIFDIRTSNLLTTENLYFGASMSLKKQLLSTSKTTYLKVTFTTSVSREVKLF